MSPDAPERGPDSAFQLATTVCGVDASPESAEAVRQATELTDEGGRLYAVAVWDPRLAMHAGFQAPQAAADLRQEAISALERTRKVFPAFELMLIRPTTLRAFWPLPPISRPISSR